jgi:DNA-binding NarL/FixJ family response regulator
LGEPIDIDIERQKSPVILAMANLPEMLCDLLQRAFQDVTDIQVVEPVNDIHYLTSASSPGAADVILIGKLKAQDIWSIATLLRSLSENQKNARIIALPQDPDYSEVISLFRAGARGVLSIPDLKFELLCKCIRSVYEGQIWAKNEYLAYLVSSLSHPKSTTATDHQGRPLLTAREQEVLHLLADGLSNLQLAAELKLSEHTIKNHLFRIYDKLGVSNRMEAVLYALTPKIAPLPKKRPVSELPPTEIHVVRSK